MMIIFLLFLITFVSAIALLQSPPQPPYVDYDYEVLINGLEWAFADQDCCDDDDFEIYTQRTQTRVISWTQLQQTMYVNLTVTGLNGTLLPLGTNNWALSVVP